MAKLKTFFFALALTGFSIGSALAQPFAGGTGTAGDPYLIETAEQLAQLAALVNAGELAYSSAHYRLENDLDLSGYSAGEGWIPIGNLNNTFHGVFDGNEHVITGLYISRSSSYQGLFGRTDGATIKNLGLEGVDISGSMNIGGIVGAGTATISHCYVTGTISSTLGRAGGIAGDFYGTISHCYSTAAVSASQSGYYYGVGGIVGEIGSATVSHCYSTGTLSGIDNFVTGIAADVRHGSTVSHSVALNQSIITSSSTFGRVSGRVIEESVLTNNLGFINMINPDGSTSWNSVGLDAKDGADITVAELHGDGTLGGRFLAADGWTVENGKLPGLFGSAVDMPNHLSLIAIAPTITTTTLPNGKAGKSYSKTLTADGTEPITWSIASGSLPAGLGLSGRTISGTPTEAGGFTFTLKAENEGGSDTQELILTIEEADMPPTITTESLPDGEVGEVYNYKLTATGTEPITWSLVGGSSIAGLTLSQEGVLSGTPTIAGTFRFKVYANNAIGYSEKEVEFTVNGISTPIFGVGTGTAGDPYIITSAEELALLATQVNSGEIAYSSAHYQLENDLDLSGYNTGGGWIPIGNLNNIFQGVFDGNNHVITGLYISRSSNYQGLFGRISESTIKNLGLEGVDISGSMNIGGIVGAGTATISHCYVTGTISSTLGRAGGIAGDFYGTISHCYSTAAVSGSQSGYYYGVGGIVGELGSATVSHCYSTGTLSGIGNFVTGIAADVRHGSTVSHCVGLNQSIITSSSTFGRVSGRVIEASVLTNNLGFINMINPDGSTSWNNVGLNAIDGEDITVAELHSDGTLGGRFLAADGWTVEDGKLPGLFGSAVDMPEHLSFTAIAPAITTTTLPNGKVDKSYTQTLTADGTEPITWSITSGNLPTGVGLSGRTISGTPTESGDFTFTLKAENEGGSDTQEFVLTIEEADVVPTITTESLPDGEVGEVYNYKLTATGTEPITWSLVGGSSIAGLTLSQEGVLSGTPTSSGAFNFSIRAANVAGSDTKGFTLTIDGVTGISGEVAERVVIYPNPTSSILHFSHEMTYEISDLQGRVLLKSNSLSKNVNISSLPSGLYLVRLTNQTGKVLIQRVVKE